MTEPTAPPPDAPLFLFVWVWGFVEGILILIASPGTRYAHDAAGRPRRA